MTKEAAEAFPSRLRSWVGSAAALFTLASPLAAQFGPPPRAPRPVTVIQNGTVHVGNGDVLEGATVIVRGSRIEAVGKGLAAPEGATVIDATGKHVYPGLIDAESTLLLDPAVHRGGEGNVIATAVDALDPFDSEPIADALGAGVTAVGVSTRRGLLDGRGAVVKLKPKAPASELVLRKETALTVNFGLNGDRPSMRLREWKTFADQLQQTKKYVESWDEYQEKLEEYKKEIEKAKKAGDTKLPESAKKDAPAPAPEAPKAEPQQGPGEGGRRGWPRRPRGSLIDQLLAAIEESGQGDALAQGAPPQAPPQGGPPGGAPPGGEKKEEGPKKPPRPPRDASKEVLRQVLEGKIALDVYADAAADLQNLIELSRQFHFRFAVTGGREAARVAAELAKAGVAVVVVQPHDLASESLSTAAELDEAGVSVVITTAGRSGGATRHLTLSAAAAIAGGMAKESALAAITSRAAALLGVADRVGTLEAGKDADLLITNGELFSSTAVVERVLVDGVSVVSK
jgi:hypothetical protein